MMCLCLPSERRKNPSCRSVTYRIPSFSNLLLGCVASVANSCLLNRISCDWEHNNSSFDVCMYGKLLVLKKEKRNDEKREKEKNGKRDGIKIKHAQTNEKLITMQDKSNVEFYLSFSASLNTLSTLPTAQHTNRESKSLTHIGFAWWYQLHISQSFHNRWLTKSNGTYFVWTSNSL